MLENLKSNNMMDFAEILIDEQSNPNALLLEVLTIGYSEWDFIVAVEGRDDQAFYYDYMLKYLDTKNLYFLDCKGKSSLITFKKIADQYEWTDRPKILYLCDKDYDDFLEMKVDGIWYTSLYSIENYVVEDRFIEWILSKYSLGSISLRDRDMIISAYRSRKEDCRKAILPVAALMCEIRALGEHPDFDQFGIEEIFSVEDEALPTRGKKASRLIKKLGVQKRPQYKQVRERAKIFAANEFQVWARGKLALQVARKCYHLARQAMPRPVMEKLPTADRLSRESLSQVSASGIELPGLENYCALCRKD